ncbi:MAG TPA: glycosyltransferase [Mycobacteriales bacterium]|nr:glycosyltransferase [Mycobacteriales bacterium]
MTSPRAPKVVMLVDNTVDGDSRVQKSARYMAELGWDVTLVGRSPGDDVREEPLGDATLLRVPTALPLNLRARLAPGHTWRYPLAYTDSETAKHAEAVASWQRIDLQTRLATSSTLAGLLPRLVVKARRVVHRERHRQLKAASRRAARPTSRAGLPWRGKARQWAWDDPFLADLEVAFAPVLAKLEPDLVHAHDFRTIGIAVRYKQRMRRRKGPKPVVVYDAHEFLPGVGIPDARRRRGDESYEAVHLPHADAVVCVAQTTGEELVRRHGLPRPPLVVLNAPHARSGRWYDDAPDVRSAAGVPAGAPLLVYVGVSAAKRGLDTVLAALPQLPDAHLVLLTKRNGYVTQLVKDAEAAGCADRLHVLPYVAPDDVSAFVRTADVGLSPLTHTLNHELTLPTKLLEYALGRIPVVTSDVRASAELVEREGIGLSHPAEDVDAFAEAVRTVLADRARFVAPYSETDLLERWSWETQCHPVDDLYREVLGRGPDAAVTRLRAVEAQLTQGEAPATQDLLGATTDLLAAADASLRDADVRSAARDAARAAAVLFHRTLHFDLETSPLTEAPDSYLAPWHASEVGARAARRSGAGPRASGPVEDVAVLSLKNFDFVAPLERDLTALGIRSHRVDLGVDSAGTPLTPAAQLAARLDASDERAWSAALDARLGDSDTVWVEWSQRAAVVASLLTGSPRRTIVRLHSFEAWTVFPQLVDWSRVDDLVFVGPHLRDLIVPRLPGLDPTTTRLHVLPISVDTARWALPKLPGADRTLAVIGWAAPAKQAVWALDLLARLRRHDPGYRLLLVGKEPDAKGPAGLRRYHHEVLRRARQPDVADAVELVPFTSDVPGLLQRAGFVVSSSVRESLHMAVLEGAASGAVPVVRDWPMLAAYDGPRRLFPPHWVVDTLEAAEMRVLGASSPDAFAAAGAEAQATARERFDDRIAQEQLARLLRGA